MRSPSDLAAKRAYLAGRSNVDYGLAAHVWPEDIAGIPELWRAGVVFFKLFTCTTHGVPGLSAPELPALTALAAVDGRALVHCEDETMTSMAEWSLRRAGRHDPGLLVEWRSRRAELSALTMVGALAAATGATITFAHVTTKQSRWCRPPGAGGRCRRRGVSAVSGAGRDRSARPGGAPQVHPAGSQPQRRRARPDVAGLAEWVADPRRHRPRSVHHRAEDGRRHLGGALRAPRARHHLPVHGRCALRGVLTLDEVALRCAAIPAERYGLAPAKGAIRVGADADMVLIDPNATWRVERADIISKAGWSPFEGRTFRGRTIATYLRGEEIARDGSCHDLRSGKFIPGAGAGR